MRTTTRLASQVAALLAATAFLAPVVASAEGVPTLNRQNYPQSLTYRPIVLAPGMAQVSGALILNLSSDQALKPWSVAPDLWYGANEKLMVGITHTHHGEPRPGDGLCLAGKSNRCLKVYNNLGLDIIYAIGRAFGFRGGIETPHIAGDSAAGDQKGFQFGVNLGFLGKLMAGNVAIVLDPHLYAGITDRDNGNKERIYVPIGLQVTFTPAVAGFAQSGVEGPVSGYGSNYRVPLGIGVLLAVGNKLDLGARCDFLNLLGKHPAPPTGKAPGAADEREMTVFLAFRI